MLRQKIWSQFYSLEDKWAGKGGVSTRLWPLLQSSSLPTPSASIPPSPLLDTATRDSVKLGRNLCVFSFFFPFFQSRLHSASDTLLSARKPLREKGGVKSHSEDASLYKFCVFSPSATKRVPRQQAPPLPPHSKAALEKNWLDFKSCAGRNKDPISIDSFLFFFLMYFFPSLRFTDFLHFTLGRANLHCCRNTCSW